MTNHHSGLIFAAAIGGLLASGAVSVSAHAASDTALQLAAVRARPLPDCSEGYVKTPQHVDGKYVVYECVMTVRCADGFTAEQYEVVEENGVIRQRYRCKAIDKSQVISVDKDNT